MVRTSEYLSLLLNYKDTEEDDLVWIDIVANLDDLLLTHGIVQSDIIQGLSSFVRELYQTIFQKVYIIPRSSPSTSPICYPDGDKLVYLFLSPLQ